MEVGLIRKGGKGIAGTYENAGCHAKPCLPLIKALESQAMAFGFDKWQQGNNVHVFTNKDGRKFDIVPYHNGVEYVGLEYRFRESRSKAISIMAVTDIKEINNLITVIKCTAIPLMKNQSVASKFKESVK